MKNSLFICVFMLVIFSLFAQVPGWEWAACAGGIGYDHANAMGIDNQENNYIAGIFEGTANFGSYSVEGEGITDIFVAKVDEFGNWEWVTQAGGPGFDGVGGIITESVGSSYVTGSFSETANFGPHSLTSLGEYDIFVARVGTNGEWSWVSQAGGTLANSGTDIARDNDGNCHITGFFDGTATFGDSILISNGGIDIFVAKIDGNGNWLWAARAGGWGSQLANAISVDANGNSYITGYFNGDAVFGADSLSSYTSSDIFVAKINTSGEWQWAIQIDGIGQDAGNCISTDDSGFSYLGGVFSESITIGTDYFTSNGLKDIFVAKIDPDGNWLWAEQVGGFDDDYINDLALRQGNSYITGSFNHTVNFGSYSLYCNDTSIFAAKINTFGNWEWASNAIGAGDSGLAITSGFSGRSYVTGWINGVTTFGSHTITSAGNYDVFVAKLNPSVSAGYELPESKITLSNYPNPFNPFTTISFNLTSKQNEQYELVIYNLKGQKIRTFSNLQMNQSPNQQIIWNGTDENNHPVSSGVYFCKLKSRDIEVSKKMLLMK